MAHPHQQAGIMDPPKTPPPDDPLFRPSGASAHRPTRTRCPPCSHNPAPPHLHSAPPPRNLTLFPESTTFRLPHNALPQTRQNEDLPDPGLRVATFANSWRYTEEGEVRDERPEPSAVAAMAMLPQKTQSPGHATVARHQWAEHRLVDVAESSRETHLASQCSHAATAAQSAKVHPANGTRTGSAQPRPPERPPPAHDRIPTGRSAQPPFWRELRSRGKGQPQRPCPVEELPQRSRQP